MKSYGNWQQVVTYATWHANACAYVAAKVCKRATLIAIDAKTEGLYTGAMAWTSLVRMESLLAVAEDVKTKNRQGKAVVNMSCKCLAAPGTSSILFSRNMFCNLKYYGNVLTILLLPRGNIYANHRRGKGRPL